MRIKPFLSYVPLACGILGALLTSLALRALWPEWRWHEEPLHSTMEAIGGLTSIAMAVVLFQRRDKPDDRTFQAMAVGFLGMGILDAFHAIAVPGDGFVLLRNMASLAGGVGFGLVWLSNSGRDALGRPWLPWIVTAGAFAFGAWALAFPERVPEMIRNGDFTPTAVAPQSLACLLFFGAAIRFLLDYRESGQSPCPRAAALWAGRFVPLLANADDECAERDQSRMHIATQNSPSLQLKPMASAPSLA
jgi:hypothetical protein